MTVVVAVKDGNRVVMAADSQAINNGHTATLPPWRSKIVRRGEFLFGCSGGLAFMDAVRHHLAEPSKLEAQPLAEWCALTLSPWIRQWCAERQVSEVKDGVLWHPGVVLVAWRGELCTVEGDGGVLVLERPYLAIGSGRCEAYGAMWARSGTELLPADPPEVVARLGVAAAISMDAACGGPIVMEATVPEGKDANAVPA